MRTLCATVALLAIWCIPAAVNSQSQRSDFFQPTCDKTYLIQPGNIELVLHVHNEKFTQLASDAVLARQGARYPSLDSSEASFYTSGADNLTGLDWHPDPRMDCAGFVLSHLFPEYSMYSGVCEADPFYSRLILGPRRSLNNPDDLWTEVTNWSNAEHGDVMVFVNSNPAASHVAYVLGPISSGDPTGTLAAGVAFLSKDGTEGLYHVGFTLPLPSSLNLVDPLSTDPLVQTHANGLTENVHIYRPPKNGLRMQEKSRGVCDDSTKWGAYLDQEMQRVENAMKSCSFDQALEVLRLMDELKGPKPEGDFILNPDPSSIFVNQLKMHSKDFGFIAKVEELIYDAERGQALMKQGLPCSQVTKTAYGPFIVPPGEWTHTGIQLKAGDAFAWQASGKVHWSKDPHPPFSSSLGWDPRGYLRERWNKEGLVENYVCCRLKALVGKELAAVWDGLSPGGRALEDGELLLGMTDTDTDTTPLTLTDLGAVGHPDQDTIVGQFDVTITTTSGSQISSPPIIAAGGGGPLNLQDAFILGVQTGFTEVVTLHNANTSYLVQQVFPTMPSYAVALGLPRDNLDALIAQLSAGVASRRAYGNLAFGLGLPRSGLHALGGQLSSGAASGQAYASVMSVRNQFYQQLNHNCSCGNVVNLAAMFQAGELVGSAEMLAFLNGDRKELAATLANAKQFAAAAGLPTDGLDSVNAHLQAGANPCDLAQELQTIEKQYEQVTNQACTCMYEAAKDVLGARWDETESGHHGVWSRRGNSNVFDGNIDGVTTEMTITIAGNTVSVARRKSSDGNDCNYRGTLSGDARSVKGTYVCKNGGPYTWEATITR